MSWPKKAGLVRWDQWTDGLPYRRNKLCKYRTDSNRAVIGRTLGAASGNGFSCVLSLRSKTGAAAGGRRHGTKKGVRRKKGWYDERVGVCRQRTTQFICPCLATANLVWPRGTTRFSCLLLNKRVFRSQRLLQEIASAEQSKDVKLQQENGQVEDERKVLRNTGLISPVASAAVTTLANTLRKSGATDGSNIPARS